MVKLRSLGFSWEDIARMLLVSRWNIHCRVSEFDLNHLQRFSDITDGQLDSKVSAFLREHGCLIGSSMVLGHLRSERLVVQHLTADIGRQESSYDDFIWYGYDPSVPTLMDDGLSTIEVEDVNIELPGNVTQDLTAAVNPLQLSNRYGIDLFIDCLNILQSNA